MPHPPEYPFPKIDGGATLEVAPGIHWVRMALPFALDHVNLWLLEDGDGWTAVDTGYNDDITRERWLAALDRLGGGRRVKRLVVTHFHPDHASLAGWFAERWGAALWMSYAEWLQAHLNRLGGATADMDARLAFYVKNGMGDEAVAGYRTHRPDFSKLILPLPQTLHRLSDGEAFDIGGRRWRVIAGGGHSPEHAALWCEEAGVLISGDQVLPRITTNVSLQAIEPDGDPLRLYLDSLDKFRALPAETLVLPSHDRPFHGLHDRLDVLVAHHDERLEAALAACAEPKTAVELIPVLFKRRMDNQQLGFAIGEALSHANYLVGDGRLIRFEDANGILRYRQA